MKGDYGAAGGGVGDEEGAVVGFEHFGGHAEADAHAAFFFGEKEFGVIGEGLGRKSLTGVAKDEAEAIAPPAGDSEGPAGGHGLDGVDDDIADGLGESAAVDIGLKVLRNFGDDLDASVIGLRGEGADDGGADVGEVSGSGLRWSWASEEHPLIDEAFNFSGFAEEDGEGMLEGGGLLGWGR